MVSNETVLGLMKDGKLDLNKLEQLAGDNDGNPVTVSEWRACYNPNTPYMQIYCKVTADNPNNPITSINVYISPANGNTVFAAQSSGGFSTNEFDANVGTALYVPSMGANLLCVVMGGTENGAGFVFNQSLTIGPC